MQLRGPSSRPVALVVLLAAAACADGGAEEPYATCKPPECAPAQNRYAAEVVGVQTSSLPSVEFSDLILDIESGYFALELPEPALIGGTVTAGGLPVAATVVFTRPSRIPGRPAIFYQASVDVQGRFMAQIPPNLPGEDYTVRVQPSDPTRYPPTAIVAHLDGSQDLSLAIASGDQLATLQGTIHDALGGAIGEARVLLRDAVSLLDVSTIGRTAADGSFTLKVPVNATTLAQTLVLAIERGTAATGLLALTLELTPAEVKAKLIEQSFSLQLPALPPPTRLGMKIVGAATNGIDKPVGGAHVLLRTSLVDNGVLGTIRARHEIEAQTNDEGKIEVDVYSNDLGARDYTIAISPPADSEFQSSSATITVGTTSGVGAPVRLPLRPVLTGRVLDPAGVPLKGAVLQPSFASELAIAQATSLATSSKTASATTDVDGRFVFRVDVGNYELGLIPPSGAQLPRRWLPAQTIDHDRDLGDLLAPMPIKFDGVVIGADGQPLRTREGTPIASSVRLYLVPAGNVACDAEALQCLLPPRLQAEGTTNKDGRASLLLAADGT